MENAHTNYEELFTTDVLNAVRPYAEKLSKRTRGALSAEDLIHDAIKHLITRSTEARDITQLLSTRISYRYADWVQGRNRGRWGTEASECHAFFSAVELPVDDGFHAISTGNPVEGWELPLDIERAVHTLNAEEQQLVRWRFWEELFDREIAEKLGLTREAVTRRFPAILAKLQKQLHAYGLTEPVGSTSHG